MAQMQATHSATSRLTAAAGETTGAATRSMLKRPRIGETIIQNLLFLCGLVSILTTVGILYTLGENSLLFFTQQAYEQARFDLVERAVVANMGTEVSLSEPMTASTSKVVISLGTRASLPFANDQLVVIGDEEMRVLDANTRELTVERGVNGTTPAAHDAEEPVFVHVDRTVLLGEEMGPSETEVVLIPGATSAFNVDDVIQSGEELMRITAIDAATDTLTVERGFDGTSANRHSENLPVFIPKPVTLTEFFTSTQWNPQLGRIGIWPLLNATLMTTFFALLTSIPIGLGVAIFLSEFASPRARAIVKPILELLVGVPTVVYGYFALTWMTPLLQSIIGVQVKQFNTLSAGLVMGIMIVPTVASISEDALSAVPRALREASYALGSTKLETISKVVLPAAVSGIMAACLLGISRAVGETMIVALAAGAGPNFTFNPLEGAETMTGHIVRISGGDISYNTIDYNSLFAIGLLLFVLTLVFNVISGIVTRRFREIY